jgi:hypothetical protein
MADVLPKRDMAVILLIYNPISIGGRIQRQVNSTVAGMFMDVSELKKTEEELLTCTRSHGITGDQPVLNRYIRRRDTRHVRINTEIQFLDGFGQMKFRYIQRR